MEPLTIAKIGLSALSFLGSRKDARANRDAGTLDLARLRRDATANGFNPLTVLNATGGQGFARPGAQPGFLSHVGAFGGQLVSDLYETSRQRKNDEISNALLTAQTANLNMSTAMMPMRSMPSMPQTSISGNPSEPVSWDEQEWWTVYNPDGTPFEIASKVAESVGLEKGGVFNAGMQAEIGGEISQEVFGVGTMIKQTSDSWFGTGQGGFIRPAGVRGPAPAIAPAIQDAPPPLLLPPVPPMIMQNPNPASGWNDYLGFQ